MLSSLFNLAYIGIITHLPFDKLAVQIILYNLIAKILLWDCRRVQVIPKIQTLKHKIASNYEVKRKIDEEGFECFGN